MAIKLPPTLKVPSVSVTSGPLIDTEAPEAIWTKSPPVVIVVGSVLNTGRLLVLDSDPRTFSRLPVIRRLPLITWNSGRSRSGGIAVIATTSKALPRIVSAVMPAGTVTTGIGAAAAAAANGTRADPILMFVGNVCGDVSGTTHPGHPAEFAMPDPSPPTPTAALPVSAPRTAEVAWAIWPFT